MRLLNYLLLNYTFILIFYAYPLILSTYPELILLFMYMTLHPYQNELAITLGRLGYVCTRDVAPHLEEFAQRWSVSFYYYILTIFFIYFIIMSDLLT